MRPSSVFKTTLLNSKGQVAIFVALVFQVLFLFFAMVINVGLLVHHKINLQNSVDMAAYYGAMKQAENLNAIAHINYQIRQSWKLLAFRYRIIGSAGEENNSPALRQHPFVDEPVSQGRLDNAEDVVVNDTRFVQFSPFCALYKPFEEAPPNENLCRNMAQQEIVLPKPPKPSSVTISPIGLSIQRVLDKLVEDAREKIHVRCEWAGAVNYLVLGKFISAFYADQESRMEVIKLISDSMTESDIDFKDIDGESVRSGVVATLKNNLTAPNADTLSENEVVTFNSMGSGACAGPGLGGWKKWIAPIKIWPQFLFIDTHKCAGNDIRLRSSDMNDPNVPRKVFEREPPEDHPFYSEVVEMQKSIIIDPSNVNSMYNPSLGVEKNPWCVTYFGVKASSSPRIPFSPFGRIKLTAQAIAKPFGGRVGPWYTKRWPRGSTDSGFDTQLMTDPLLPSRIRGGYTPAADDSRNIPNYSRYIGDLYGLKSREPNGYWGRAIFKTGGQWKSYGGPTVSYKQWDHLKAADSTMLASGGSASGMRNLELSAILPDMFDVAYYSIEPDFYNNYFGRLRAGLAQGIKDKVRPDLGSEASGDLSNFSVKDQYKVITGEVLKSLSVDFGQRFKYITTDWANTLTSWVSFGMGDYKVDEERFGRCRVPISDGDDPTPGNCKAFGGTTGYGVKLVSPKFLQRKDLELGGAGLRGGIENPPPADLF